VIRSWSHLTLTFDFDSYFRIILIQAIILHITFMLHFQCEGISLEYLGHLRVSRSGVNLKVTVAKQRQRAGLCSPRTQFNVTC